MAGKILDVVGVAVQACARPGVLVLDAKARTAMNAEGVDVGWAGNRPVDELNAKFERCRWCGASSRIH